MASILDIIAEKARQNLTGDDAWSKDLPWVFRIVVEGERFVGPVGADGTATFPLPVTPGEFKYDLPFANNVTPAQGGGVVIDEAGVVVGDIEIRGTTGFKLRKETASYSGPADAVLTSHIPNQGIQWNQDVSGQMAFWTLASRCFEGYGRLMRDPALGPKTRMELHIVKEQLHVEVIPVRFSLSRDRSSRATYSYDISLRVVGPAKQMSFPSLTESSWIKSVKDGIATAKEAINSITATLDDITAAIGEITRIASSAAHLVDSVTSIVSAADDLINGTKAFLDIPKGLFESTLTLCESVGEVFSDAAEFPAAVYETFKGLEDGLDKLKVALRSSFSTRIEGISDRYESLSSSSPTSPEDVSSVEEKSTQGETSLDGAFSGPWKSGDALRATAQAPARRIDTSRYSGFRQYTVSQGDTLVSLASRFLLDHTRWVDIAAANHLSPPFISERTPIPGTAAIGSTIVIPIPSSSRSDDVVSSDESTGGDQTDAILGTDAKIERDGNLFGWEVDTAHGATDMVLVSGIDNLKQAIESRLRTERGEIAAYPYVGLPRLVGASSGDSAVALATFYVREQLLADSRIERVKRFDAEVSGDEIAVVADVEPKGMDGTRVVARIVT